MGSLYVHIPFCVAKCSYCDFVSCPLATSQVDTTSYLDALKTEMELRQSQIRAVSPIESIYIGGGTPTCLPSDDLAGLAACLTAFADAGELREFTVEANPATCDQDSLTVLRAAGVNRLSIGVQSLQPEELKALGRVHDPQQALKALADARTAGFDNVNVDLIIGAPSQTLCSLERTIYQIIQMRPAHVSAYCLQLEDGTSLERAVAAGLMEVPDDDCVRDLYDKATQMLCDAGYTRYEVSNFALLGRECIHNMGYWTCGEYVGLGAAAHSHISSAGNWVRSWNTSDVFDYVRRLSVARQATIGAEELGAYQEAHDCIMLGLRMADGVDLASVERRFGVSVIEELMPRLRIREAQGIMAIEGTRVRILSHAALISNIVLTDCI